MIFQAEETISIDPRTQLPLVDVPPAFDTAFSDIRGCVIHLFQLVRIITPSSTFSKETESVLILGDSALYICDRKNSSILRCMMVSQMRQLYIRDTCFAVKVAENSSEYDLMVRLNTADESHSLAEYLRRIFWVHMGAVLKVQSVIDTPSFVLESVLRLAKPPNYVLRIEPIRTRGQLQRMLKEFVLAEARREAAMHDEFIRIKQDLQLELENTRNSRFDDLVRQNLQLLQDGKEKAEDIVVLRKLLETFVPDIDDALHRAKTIAVYTTECGKCREHRRIIDEHANINKLRLLAAEDALVELNRQCMTQRDQIGPLRQEVLTLRSSLDDIHHILSNEGLSLSERAQKALSISGPLASHPLAVQRPSVPLRASDRQLQMTFAEEIQALKSLLYETKVMYGRELHELKKKFEEYDRCMIAALKDRLETYVPLTRVSTHEAAMNIVTLAQSEVRRGTVPKRGDSVASGASPVAHQQPMNEGPIVDVAGLGQDSMGPMLWANQPNPLFASRNANGSQERSPYR